MKQGNLQTVIYVQWNLSLATTSMIEFIIYNRQPL